MKKVKLTDEQRELLRIMDVDIHSYDAATNTCELRECIFDALQRLKVDLVEVKEPEFNEPWNLEGDDIYYYIDSFNFTVKSSRCGCAKVYNRFKYRERAEQCVKKMKINNTLEAFSLANGGDEIDCENEESFWFISYNFLDKKLETIWQKYAIALNVVYFISKEVAQEAIRRYGDEFIEAYKIEEAQIGK